MVNNTEEFNLDFDRVQKLDSLKKSASSYHLLHKQKNYHADLINSDFSSKTYTISINSNTYEVQIKSQLEELIKKMGYSSKSSKVLNTINAPMPGTIIDLNVELGQEVRKGDVLLILEAMKMENAIHCPKDAKIKGINIKIGDTVDKNKLLIELE